MSTRRQETARKGERVAEEHLAAACFVRVARNLRVGSHEADLVVRDPDGETLVVVEVKTRTTGGSWPEERIDRVKLRHLARIVRTLASRTRRPTAWRVDAVGVTLVEGEPPVIVHHRNVV